MKIDRLTLKDFRSYESCEISFGDKANLIVGSNGVGKTNLAEAIYYLSMARSWRTSEDDTLVTNGKYNARLEAKVVEGALRRTISVDIDRDAKRVKVNGKPVAKLSDLTELINVLVFSPDDVNIFRGAPADRRSYLDASISKENRDYLKLLTQAHNVLRQRNLLLKSMSPNRMLLMTYADQLSALAEPIVNARKAYCDRLNAVLPEILSKIAGKPLQGEIIYKPFVAPGENFRKRAFRIYDSRLNDDIFRKTTGVGIQREDFVFHFEGKEIGEFGSQGENRIAALALKIAPYYLIDKEDRKPICVLDDVTSELDADRVANLLKLVQNELGQTFITATEPIDIPGAVIIDVADHKATRRNDNGR